MSTLVKPSPGNISSGFGPRTGAGSSFHQGVDFSWMRHDGIQDWGVYAARAGRVVFADYSGGFGKLIRIDHGDRIETYYAHLAAFSVKVGDIVPARRRIGTIGNTGASFGAHLHFEYRINGTPTNPTPFWGGTAGDGGSAIPEERRNSMATLYRKQDSEPTLYALAGDSPGTSANWLEFRSYTLAQTLAKAHGNSSLLSAGTWDEWRAAYLEPLDTVGAGGVDLRPILDAIGTITPPDPAVIAKAVNDDAHQRMQS